MTVSGFLIDLFWVIWIGAVIAVPIVRPRLVLRRLTRQIRELRELLDREVVYRPIADDDPEIAPIAPAIAPHASALGALGFRSLGVIAEGAPGAAYGGVSRWYVSADGETLARAGSGRVRGQLAPVSLMLSSHAGQERWLTLQTRRRAGVPVPPFVHLVDYRFEVPLASVLEKHRARLAGAPALQPFTDRAQVIAALQAARAQGLAWRRAQPPDALLDHDLRAILGVRYEQLGPRLAAALTAAPPAARVVAR